MVEAGCPGWAPWDIYTLVKLPTGPWFAWSITLLFEDLRINRVTGSPIVEQILEG